MTERWRKKLENIDGASPSDEVFERAKEGPMHPDDALPGPRMSTRVITIVAAFLVFALAISVFAIPALRIGNQAAGQGSVLLPLWPAQTSDQLEELQANPPSWALDPAQVAQRFGQEVMGWSSTSVADAACDLPAYGAGSSSSPSPFLANDGSFSEGCVSIINWGPSSAPPGYPYATDPASPAQDGAFRSYSIYPFDPHTLQWLEQPPAEYVQVYQPLEQGDGQIWAVRQAQGRETLSVAPGQVVHDGSSVSAGFVTGRGLVPTLGYGSCGQSAASSEFRLPGGFIGAGIQVDVHLTGGCEGEQPGYVWAATSNVSLADTGDGIVDPFAGVHPALASITAAPVTMIFPAADAETTAPTSPTLEPSASPTAEPEKWTTYTDPLGWTIDVPDQWVMENIDGSDGRRTHAGAAFISGTPLTSDSEVGSFDPPPGGVTVMIQHIEGGALSLGDDSSFPLSFHQGEGAVQEIDFRGDGLDFVATVETGDAGPLTSTQEEMVQRMVASIQFQPWSVGETRSNNWTAIGSVLPASSAEWIAFQGAHYIASRADGVRQLLGPAPECASGTGTFEVRETGVAGISCPDGTSGDWDFSTGEPQPGNSARFAKTLPAYAAERSWDGMLLAQLP